MATATRHQESEHGVFSCACLASTRNRERSATRVLKGPRQTKASGKGEAEKNQSYSRLVGPIAKGDPRGYWLMQQSHDLSAGRREKNHRDGRPEAERPRKWRNSPTGPILNGHVGCKGIYEQKRLDSNIAMMIASEKGKAVDLTSSSL